MGAAIGLFLFQVGMRISDFFEHKTSVDVKLKYVTKVDFPAVTVCNQNSFRSGEFSVSFPDTEMNHGPGGVGSEFCPPHPQPVLWREEQTVQQLLSEHEKIRIVR